MRVFLPLWAFAVIAALHSMGCADAKPTPALGFDAVLPAVVGELMTNSSPNIIDLDGDRVPDIVFGTGVDRVQPDSAGRYVFTNEPDTPGFVIAVTGATNEILWKAPHPGDAFTTARFADLNGDNVPDVVMGGREGAFGAYSGVDGTRIWRVAPADVAETPVPYNFMSPTFIPDADDDRITDLVVVYGGDATKLPGEPRDPGYLAVISGANGSVLAVHTTPDGQESYSSTVVYERNDGSQWLVFGTGGETDGGAAYRAPLGSLLDGTFPARVERLIAPGTKGAIAPATIVELSGDDESDIVLSTFDGRLIAVNGSTRDVLWQHESDGEETYHPAAVVRIQRDGRLGLFISRGIGVFPRYVGTIHRLHDAADGRVLYEHRDANHPAGAPLAIDLDGDGIDEPFFFSMRYPTAQGGRIYILHAVSRALITHDVPTNLASTPLIADPRETGTLELIGLSWSIGETPDEPDWRDLEWQLLRMDLSVETPSFMGWAGYMGTAGNGIYRR